MKLLIILAVTALCNGAKLDRTYLPPNAQTSGGSDYFLQTPLSEQPLQNTFQPSRNSAPSNSYSRNDIARLSAEIGQSNGIAPGFGPGGQNNVYSQSGLNGIQNGEYQANGFSNLAAFETKPERAEAAFERNAAILRQSNENDGERYSYAYETENGIYAEENGVATNGVEAEGGFSYTGDDGQVYSIRYTADQNGFVPQGEHLPTPPPVPEEILKALEQNARDEAAGIYDDGSYNEAKYASEESQGYDFNANNQYSNGNNQANDDAVVVNSAFGSNGAAGFGRTIPTFGNNAPSFGKNGASFANNAPNYGSNAFGQATSVPSFGRSEAVSPVYGAPSISGNSAPGISRPTFAKNAPNYGSNSPGQATSAPTFGNSKAASPVYGTPSISGKSAPSFGRTAPADTSSTPNFGRTIPAAETSPAFGQRNFGSSAPSGNERGDLEKAYLPPFQRTAVQNGLGRTQSFNERDGYRY